MFSGLVFLDVVFEASLFPSDGEADVFVEVYVAVGSNVVDLFVVSILFHCLRVVEFFACRLSGHGPVDSMPRRFRSSLTYSRSL